MEPEESEFFSLQLSTVDLLSSMFFGEGELTMSDNDANTLSRHPRAADYSFTYISFSKDQLCTFSDYQNA